VLNTCLFAAVLVTIGWVAAMMVPLFAILKRVGLLRVDEHGEDIGLDLALHGGSCYPEVSEVSPVHDEPDVMVAKQHPEPDCSSKLIAARVNVSEAVPAVHE
jgi:hypothetical protein